MSATDEYGSYRSPSGWVGWIIFAAVFMMTIGTMNAIQGLAGIFRDEEYLTSSLGEGTNLLVFDWTAWGWIHLLFGIAMVIVGALLIQGSTFARVVAIFLVALNMISQFTFISVYPWWSLALLAIDILIMYALIVHGREMKV